MTNDEGMTKLSADGGLEERTEVRGQILGNSVIGDQ